MMRQISAIDRFCILLATGFYSGFCPKSPGTAGTVVAAVLHAVAIRFFPSLSNCRAAIGLALTTTLIGIVISERVYRLGIYGDGNKDPQQIVIDEFAGYFVAIAGLPHSAHQLFLSFVLFRLFDITKPPPVSTLEKLPGGAGIVLDDVAAGIFANLSAHILLLASL